MVLKLWDIGLRIRSILLKTLVFNISKRAVSNSLYFLVNNY